MALLLALLAAMLIVSLAVPPAARLARRLRLVDVPGGRKRHLHPVPRSGGVPLALGVLVPLALWGRGMPGVEGVALGLGLAAAVGLADDLWDLPPTAKLAGQALAALVVAHWGGVRVASLGYLDGGREVLLGAAALPATVLLLVTATNAVNLADGLDGLAGGLCLLSFGFMGLLAAQAGNRFVLLLSVCSVGALIGFLRHNTHPATVFLGDAGSHFLGLSLGAAAVCVTQDSPYSPLLFPFLVGVPLLDLAYVSAVRLSQGRSPLHADRNHLHYRLMDLGLGHQQSVAVLYTLHLLLLAAAFLWRYQPAGRLLVAYLGVGAAMPMGLLRWRLARLPSLRWQLPNRAQAAAAARRGMIALVALLFPALPLSSRPGADAVLVLGGLLGAMGAMAVLGRRGAAEAVLRIGAYFLSGYVLLGLGGPVEAPGALHLAFGLLGLLVALFLVGTNDPPPITTLDYLLLASALVLPNLPGGLLEQLHLGPPLAELMALHLALQTVGELPLVRAAVAASLLGALARGLIP